MNNIVFVLCFVSFTVFAQEADPISMPVWLAPVLEFIQKLPWVGPVLVGALKWTAVVGMVMTAVSVFMQSLATALAGIASFAKLQKIADFIKYWEGKILPYLKYVSLFNVQKPIVKSEEIK